MFANLWYDIQYSSFYSMKGHNVLYEKYGHMSDTRLNLSPYNKYFELVMLPLHVCFLIYKVGII
jgi:hypothetical protein